MDFLLENATVLLLLLFMIVTFLQSGMDKLLDWKGNLSWYPLQKQCARTIIHCAGHGNARGPSVRHGHLSDPDDGDQ